MQQFVNFFVGLSVRAEYHAIWLHVERIIANHFLFQLPTKSSYRSFIRVVVQIFIALSDARYVKAYLLTI